MNPRARKALWILFGILLIASLFLAGPAHNVLHHGAEDIGGCDVCHFATPEPLRFERVVFWRPIERVELAVEIERLRESLLPEQGNARAPPRAG